jgi:uncharacterized protein YndB with AHSA1/START domain
MNQLHTEIEINGPAERVWAVLTDFASYPEWNPFIRQVSGELNIGAPQSPSRTTRVQGYNP